MPTFFDSTADAAEASEAFARTHPREPGLISQPRCMGLSVTCPRGCGRCGRRSTRSLMFTSARPRTRSTTPATTRQECGTRSPLRRSCVRPASPVDRACDRLAEGSSLRGGSLGIPSPPSRRPRRRGGSAWCSSRARRPTGRCASSASWDMWMRWTSSRSGTTATRPRRPRWRTGMSTTSPARAPTTGWRSRATTRWSSTRTSATSRCCAATPNRRPSPRMPNSRTGSGAGWAGAAGVVLVAGRPEASRSADGEAGWVVVRAGQDHGGQAGAGLVR